MLTNILCIVLAYLLGSIPFALVVGKLFYNTDIRQSGSGNLGGTNTFRVLGKKAGFAVTLGDILKGTIATTLPFLLHGDIHPLIVGCAAVFGHVFPIFAGFKGGKAVATSAGVMLGFNPVLFLGLAVVFFGTLYLSKYVSLASIMTAIFSVLGAFYVQDHVYTVIIIILAALLIFKHRSNISRIKNGTEPKIGWM